MGLKSAGRRIAAPSAPCKGKLEAKFHEFRTAERGGYQTPSSPIRPVIMVKTGDRLVRRVSLIEGHDEIMPARGKSLSPRQIDALRAWIAADAVWSQEFERAAHWAYVPPVRRTRPNVSEIAWPKNAIDRFILARL